MKSIILMLQFFTRLPINYQVDVKEDSFTKGLPYFPMVGLIVGLIDAAVFIGVSRILPASIAAVCAVLCNVMITGALHYDGLADTCDGVFSARSRERMLEIMKDSRIGTNGAIALCFDIGLKILLLSQLEAQKGMLLVISMTVVAKMMMSLVIFLSKDHSKGSGLGSLFLGEIGKLPLALSLVTAAIAVFIMVGSAAIPIILINILLVILYKGFIIKRLGVMTGDTMGALNELSELVTLVTFVIIERNLLL